MSWTLSVPTFASSEALSPCCIFHRHLEFPYSGHHHILLYSPPGLVQSDDFCPSITSESRLAMLTDITGNAPPDLRRNQLCTGGHSEALTQCTAQCDGDRKARFDGKYHCICQGCERQNSACICSYVEKRPPQQTTERAWTADGQTSACPGRLRLAQPWCSARHAWSSHHTCGCDWRFPRDVYNPIIRDEPPRHDCFQQYKWLGDPRSAGVWAPSLLCLIQASWVCVTRFILQVTPPGSRALPEGICFRHHWLVSSLLFWVSPSHLYLVCQAGSRSEGWRTMVALSCPSAFLQLQMLYSVWFSNDFSVVPTFLKVRYNFRK